MIFFFIKQIRLVSFPNTFTKINRFSTESFYQQSFLHQFLPMKWKLLCKIIVGVLLYILQQEHNISFFQKYVLFQCLGERYLLEMLFYYFITKCLLLGTGRSLMIGTIQVFFDWFLFPVQIIQTVLGVKFLQLDYICEIISYQLLH